MSDPIVPLSDLVQNVLTAAVAQRGKQFSEQLVDGLNQLRSCPESADVRLAISSLLPDLESPAGAGALAIWLGAAVENGADPVPTIEPILAAMVKWSRTIPTRGKETDVENQRLDEDTFIGMNMLGQSLVAHLARSDTHRSRIAKKTDVITELTRVEESAPGAQWVLEMLRRCSGSLVVLEVEKRKGVLLTYENISNCFHLFTLLQKTLTADLKPVSRPAQETACRDPLDRTNHYARWHYGRGDVSRSDLDGAIWGEASPQSIPRIHGEQVLLLWPKILRSRQWDSGFFGPDLAAAPPNVTFVEELSTHDVEEWWTTLVLPILPKKSWWKFW